MKNTLVFLSFLYIHFALGNFTDIEAVSRDQSIDSIGKCIVEISDKILFNTTLLILYQDEVIFETDDHFMNGIIDIFQQHNIAHAMLKITNLNGANKILTENILAIIHLHNCTDLSYLDTEIFFNNWKYLMIISNYNEDCDVNLNLVGQSVDQYDATFMIYDNLQVHNSNTVFTYLPEIDENTCTFSDAVKPTHINTCKDGALVNRFFFPNKSPKNFKKCPFNVGVAYMYPFTLITERLEELAPLENVTGSDVAIAKALADYMNLTLKLFYVFKNEKNPYVSTEYRNHLLNGSLDACIGGFYRIFADVLDFSGIYNRQAVIWVYAVHRDDRTWRTLLRKVNGLYIFVIFYFIYSSIWYIVSKMDEKSVCLKDTLFYSFGALIGCGSLQEAYTFKQKLLNIVYLFMSLHLSAYISIKFYSFLTIQGPPEILKTNEDIMTSGRRPFLNNETKNFIEEPKYLKYAATSEECHTFEHCALRSLEHDGVTLILDGHFILYQMKTAVDGEARILRVTENLITVYHEMLLRQNIPMTRNLQRGITRLFEAGICDHLFTKAVGLTVVSKAESARKIAMGNSYSCVEGCPISWSQTGGAFYAWGFGCGMSIFVFVVEVALSREKKTVCDVDNVDSMSGGMIENNSTVATLMDLSSGARPIDVVTEKVYSDVLKLESNVGLYNPDKPQLVGRRDDRFGIPHLDLDKDDDDVKNDRMESEETLVYSFDRK